MDIMRKELGEFFKNYNLKVSITGNMMEVNFLDAIFNLRTGLFRPFFKKLSVMLSLNPAIHQAC